MSCNRGLCVRAVLLLLAVSGVLCGCGDDDPPVGPVYPGSLTAVNGLYYKGIMGSTSVDSPLEFVVRDKSDNQLAGQWVCFSLIDGDGTLSADSLKSDSAGTVILTYSFSGQKGHAEIQALVRDVNSVDVSIRANTLIPGDHGQGQYILLSDRYEDVKNFNGPPASVDKDPSWVEIVVANYEAALGVVFVIEDDDNDGVIQDDCPVLAIIVVDSVYPQPPDYTTMCARYEGRTADSIGMGSSYWDDIVPIYGMSQDVSSDNIPYIGRVLEIGYDSLGLVFWCLDGSMAVFQIDLWSSEAGASASPDSHVAEYLSQRMRIYLPDTRR